MEAITTTTTLWEILKNSKIVVPTFQRDYAQGRAGKEDLRKKFLKEIRKSLEDNSELLLDFVYGTQKDDIIYPLDGQQRLTTLWVLMWYATFVKLANSKENELEERKEVLKHFTYETRTSSREFIYWLCNGFLTSILSKEYKEQKDKNSELSLSDFIQKQTGFYSGWKQDPTIQSVLRMLSGTQVVNKKTKKTETPHNDGIEQIFKEFDADNFDRLFCNGCPIKFYHLNLLGYKQPDNLYVKMNARGEQLTSFENFKADLIGECRRNNELKEYVEYNNKSYILTKWDNKWSQLFWDSKAPKQNIDDLFFTFIKRFLLNRYVEKSVSTLQLQPIEVSDKERSLKLDDNYNSILFNLPEGANLSSVRLNNSNKEYFWILNNSSSRTCSIELSEKGKSFQKGDYIITLGWDGAQADSSSYSKSKKIEIKPKKKNGEEDPIVKLLYTNEQKEYTSYELYQTLIDKDCVDDLMNVLDSSLSTIKEAVNNIPLLATSEQDESEDTQSQGNKAYSFIPQYAKDKNGKVLDLVKSASFAERIMMYGICRYLLIIKSTQQDQKTSVESTMVSKWLRALANLVYYNEIPNYAAYESRFKFIKRVIDELGDKISEVYACEAIKKLKGIANNKDDNDSIQLEEEIRKIELITSDPGNEQIIKKMESLWIFSGHINCLLKEEYLKDQLYESLEKIIGTKRTYVRDGDKSLLNLFRAILAMADEMPDQLVFNDDHNNLRKLLNGTLEKPFLRVIEEILNEKTLDDIIDGYQSQEEEDWKYALIRDENLWQYATQGKYVKNGNEYFWYRGTYKNKADIPLTAYSKFIKDNRIPNSINYKEKDDYWELDYGESIKKFEREGNQKMRNN